MDGETISTPNSFDPRCRAFTNCRVPDRTVWILTLLYEEEVNYTWPAVHDRITEQFRRTVERRFRVARPTKRTKSR